VDRVVRVGAAESHGIGRHAKRLDVASVDGALYIYKLAKRQV